MSAPSIDRLRQVVRIGTRRSKLSLWQANHIADLLKALEPGISIEIREYSTRGDENYAAPLPSIGVKGLFTEALEEALRRGEIDCAVHSMKDLPVDLVTDMALAAVPKRADHRDVLISRSGAPLVDLPSGARIGTGSLRRRAQLLALRPDIEVLPIRGNVPTRLAKLQMPAEQIDAIVLAAAGLQRLGLDEQISETFSAAQMLCAAGQGALAVQCLNQDDFLKFFGRLSDRASLLVTSAERAFLATLEGGCSLPVAVWAHFGGDTLHLQGRVLSEDGRQQIDVSGHASVADENGGRQLGRRLAQQALEQGAYVILRNAAPTEKG